MEKVIFDGFGCKIFNRQGRFFVRYDSGGSGSWLVESEISEREVEKLKLSKRDASEVIRDAIQREKPKRVQ